MGEKIISICKNGVRYDMPLDVKLSKGGPGSGRRPEGGSEHIEHNQRKYDTSIASSRKPGLIAYLQDKMGIERGLARQYVQSYEFKTTVNPESVRHIDSYLQHKEPVGKLQKQEPIATDEPVISRGAIVTLRGHKGKVLLVEGDEANVSWEDASISKVPIADLGYAGRVEKGGPGSGRFSDDLNNIQLRTAKHLRRQGVLPKRKK